MIVVQFVHADKTPCQQLDIPISDKQIIIIIINNNELYLSVNVFSITILIVDTLTN